MAQAGNKNEDLLGEDTAAPEIPWDSAFMMDEWALSLLVEHLTARSWVRKST
jgi:hypothetical protein